jgi:hypothetical protein
MELRWDFLSAVSIKFYFNHRIEYPAQSNQGQRAPDRQSALNERKCARYPSRVTRAGQVSWKLCSLTIPNIIFQTNDKSEVNALLSER